MTSLKTKAVLALALIATLAAAGTANAAFYRAGDLPLLVDRYYEIKNPAGPVTEYHATDDALKDPYIVRTAPQFDLKDIPNPEFEQILIGL